MSSPLKNLYIAPSRRLLRLLERTRLSEETFIIVIAFFVGIMVGLAAIGLRALITQVSFFFFPGEGTITNNIIHTSWYIKILIPVLGGLLVAPIFYYFSPEAKGMGFHEVLNSILFKGGKMNPRIVITKTVATSLTLGTGGSAGRETPIIQIGAGIGSTIGQLFKLTGKRLKTITVCGAAAGIAAAFNAPIAGAIFVVEVIVLDIAFSQFTAIITASLMGAITSKLLSGGFSGFDIPDFYIKNYSELFIFALLGLVCGLLSFIFIRTMCFTDTFFTKKLKIHPLLKPALGGLIIGIIGIYAPMVMGIGYDSISSLFKTNQIVWYGLIVLLFLKIIATSVTLGSGGSGGTLSPAIFIGAITGYIFGMAVNIIFPGSVTSPICYSLIGISGVIAGTTRAPIAAIVILFELSGNVVIVLPLFITTAFSYILASKLCSESVFTFKLSGRNIKINNGFDSNIIKQISIKSVYTASFESIYLNDNFNLVLSKILRCKGTDFPVVDSRGLVKGMISYNDIKGSVEERESLQQLLIASDIAITDFETLTFDDNCLSALNKMNKFDLEGLPVVDETSKRLLGLVWKKDIISSYFKLIEANDLVCDLAENLDLKTEYSSIHFKVGFTITEIIPPVFIVGKTIGSLNLHGKYGLDLLAIKNNVKKEYTVLPNPAMDYIIKGNDSLVIAGEIRNIQNFINLN
ncbi:MAG: chloride channel protein [bacterium]